MNNKQTSSIRFSVEESVWFKKGQEVADVLAMSLEPEISVQEHKDYITIRGALVLTGDYFPIEHEEGDEQEEQEHSIQRTIDDVMTSEDGSLHMNHHFPIDITIPTNRIQSLEDVYVLVESFDYEIQEKDRLALTAEICISGIAKEEEAVAEKKTEHRSDEEEETLFASESSMSAAEYFTNQNQYEGEREKKEEEEWSTISQISSATDRTSNDADELKFPAFQTEVRKEPINKETEEPLDSKRSISDTEITEKKEEKEEEPLEMVRRDIHVATEEKEETQATISEDASFNMVPNIPSPQIEVKGRTESLEQEWNTAASEGRNHIEQEIDKNENESEQKENSRMNTKKARNALYLTKMLSAEGDEQFSKVRIRIVQHGETIGKIAEDYDISVHQIIRKNQLEGDVLEEGQILYIPDYGTKVEKL